MFAKELNRKLRNYFGFSKSESNGVIILIIFVILIITVPFVYKYNYKSNKSNVEQGEIDSLVTILENEIRIEKETIRQQRFKKYAKNKFEYDFPNSKSKRYSKYSDNNNYSKKEYSYVKSKLEPFDINLADTTALKKIYGIGPVLSKRIIKYRDLLGGFVNKGQLSEVYGLKDSVLNKLDSITFIKSDFEPKLYSINGNDSSSLANHPYISRSIAKAIEAYRFQHGNIDSVSQLFELRILDSATVKKIYHYLKL